MEPSILEMVKELVLAQIQNGSVSPDNLTLVLNTTHQNLLALKSIEESRDQGVAGIAPATGAPLDWKKSITKQAVRCMECGASFKQLSTRHLRQHDLTSRTYRDKYGIPRAQSLAAKETTARRKQIVQQSKPWEKTSTYMKSQSKSSNGETRAAAPKSSGAARKKANTGRRK
jgi:predicted transcriptional regulator